jgi:DNA-binding CsgD family transcriptional regulator
MHFESIISHREHQILKLIVAEKTSAEIAHELYISTHTVLSHRKSIMDKLKARNTAGMVRRAFETRLIQLSSL